MQPPLPLYSCNVLTESPSQYRNGLYYPVKLGDTFKNGRYKIWHKLGWGGFSTIWLARDVITNRHVALKIIENSISSHEHEIMQHMRRFCARQGDPAVIGTEALAMLEDDFSIGASHYGLVMQVMASSVEEQMEDYAEGRLPGRIARKVARQMFRGLDCLHKAGVGHGDLHTGHILFTATEYESATEEQLFSQLGQPRIGDLTREDGEKLEEDMPPYLVGQARTLRGSDEKVRIIDFGSAFFLDTLPDHLQAALATRAPEDFFRLPVGAKSDMWSAGCALFEIITGRSTIDTGFARPATVLAESIAHLGHPPSELYERLDSNLRTQVEARARNIQAMDLDRYFRLAYSGDLLEVILTDEEKAEILVVEEEKPKPEFTASELDQLSGLLQQPLCWKSEERITAEEVLKNPFFAND